MDTKRAINLAKQGLEAEKPQKDGYDGRFRRGPDDRRRGNGRKQHSPYLKEVFIEAGPDAAALIVEIMRDEYQPIRLRKECAEIITDRNLGRAAQPIQVERADDTEHDWSQLTLAERLQTEALLLKAERRPSAADAIVEGALVLSEGVGVKLGE